MIRRLTMVGGLRPFLALVVLLGVAVTLAVRHRGHVSSLLPSTTGAVVTSEASAPRGPSFSAQGWQRGTEYVAELDYRFRLAQAGADPAAVQTGLHLTGSWRTLVVDAEPGELRLRIQLERAAIANNNPLAGQAMSEASQALGQPVYVDYDARGRAMRLHLRADTDKLVLGLLRELVSISQFSAPAQPTASWQALETDQAGEYRADYTWLGLSKFQRVKAAYIRANPTQSGTLFGGATPLIRGAVALFELDDWGRVAKLTATHELATPDAAEGAGFSSRTELSLKVSQRREGVEGAADLRNLSSIALAPGASDLTAAALDIDRQLAGDADAASLLRELSSLEAGDRDGAFAIQARLAALFRLDPRAVDNAMAQLDAKNAATILGALGAAATPTAQKALAAFASDARHDASQRQLAVDSMLAVEHPTSDLRSALKSMLNDKDSELRKNASLMLGVVAGRDGDPDAAHEVIQQMSRELKTADSAEERIRVVDSLGNTRSGEAVPALTDAMSSNDAAVRTAAAAALRFVPDPAADRLLSKALTSDSSTDVRLAALLAAGSRSYEPLAGALEEVSKRDTSSAVRAAAVSTLSSMTHQDNQSLLLLDWIAQNDKDPQVRERARRALESPAL